jgi:predicted ester cyclase
MKTIQRRSIGRRISTANRSSRRRFSRQDEKSPAKTFPPSAYRTLKAWGRGDDEICVLCHHHGKHTGGPYMGVQPTGNQLDVLWFSWLKFEGDKIVHIYSISDVLSMLKDLEVIKDVPQPVDPYK